MAHVEEVLAYLEHEHSRQDIAEKFGLSNSESWHLVRWLEKAKLVKMKDWVHIEGRSPRQKYYIAIKHPK